MNTMYVYWGGIESGKAHLRQYAMANNKTTLLWCTIGKHIIKVYNTVHYQREYWRDETVRKIIYHNIDGFRKCEREENKIYHHKPYMQGNSTINQQSKISNYRTVANYRNYSKDDINKYSQIEYINTNLYFDIIAHNIDEIGDIMNSKILDYDDIFKDVDLISHILPKYVIEDNINLLQSSINIVPYKSNKLDSIISKLDGFRIFQKHLEDDNDILEVYSIDKNRIWNWLDEFTKQHDSTIAMLEEYNIPYQMFDLDNDSYKDVFGWDIDLPRDYTHKKNSWQDNERYATIVKIAQEYLA